MTTIVPQTFGQDFVLPKLVAHFNSLPESNRTIAANSFPIFNVKVVKSGSGSPEIVVGDSSGSVTSANYLGEATYIWVGPREQAVTADASHFYEISKYINGGAPSTGGGVAVTFKTKTYSVAFGPTDGYTGGGGTDPYSGGGGTDPYSGGGSSGNTGSAAEGEGSIPSAPNYLYTFYLVDSYGDGWNGGKLVVKVNDISYELGLPNGAARNLYLIAKEGDSVSIDFVAGSYANEVSYTVKQNLNTLVYSGSGTNSGNVFNFTVPMAASGDSGGGTTTPVIVQSDITATETYTESGSGAGSGFGTWMQLNITGDVVPMIAVGEPAGDPKGAISVFKRDPYNYQWSRTTRITGSFFENISGTIGTRFGMTFDGDQIAIPYKTTGSNVPKVSTLKWLTANSATLDTTFEGPESSGFGEGPIAFDAAYGVIAIAATKDTNQYYEAGAVYLYRYDPDIGAMNTTPKKIVCPFGSDNGHFGEFIAMDPSGNALAITAERSGGARQATWIYGTGQYDNDYMMLEFTEQDNTGVNLKIRSISMISTTLVAVAYENTITGKIFIEVHLRLSSSSQTWTLAHKITEDRKTDLPLVAITRDRKFVYYTIGDGLLRRLKFSENGETIVADERFPNSTMQAATQLAALQTGNYVAFTSVTATSPLTVYKVPT